MEIYKKIKFQMVNAKKSIDRKGGKKKTKNKSKKAKQIKRAQNFMCDALHQGFFPYFFMTMVSPWYLVIT